MYCMICVDTGDVLDVGKLARIDKTGDEMPWGFGGWRDDVSGKWVDSTNLLRLVERFLIIHRGKEVRLVPLALLESVDIDSLRFIESEDQLLNCDIVPEPCEDRDLAAIPCEVITKVKEAVR